MVTSYSPATGIVLILIIDIDKTSWVQRIMQLN